MVVCAQILLRVDFTITQFLSSTAKCFNLSMLFTFCLCVLRGTNSLFLLSSYLHENFVPLQQNISCVYLRQFLWSISILSRQKKIISKNPFEFFAFIQINMISMYQYMKISWQIHVEMFFKNQTLLGVQEINYSMF